MTRRFGGKNTVWIWVSSLVAGAGLSLVVWGWVAANAVKHDFAGRCQMCHESIPAPGSSFETSSLRESLDAVCAGCHKINKNTSHPVGVKPSSTIPLQKYLDRQGRLTCVTCHQVHKERDASLGREELKGFLRGHAGGRAFCMTCHDKDRLGASWNHRLVVSYAHAPDQFEERAGGSPLDSFSAECLSCHDGVISKMNPVEVRSGSFRHGIGLSHPVGVEYPSSGRRDEFRPLSSLPGEIKLFNGKVGCLSCHNPYGGKKVLLSMENRRSALCLTCHIK